VSSTITAVGIRVLIEEPRYYLVGAQPQGCSFPSS
jgi:hypothetical protein